LGLENQSKEEFVVMLSRILPIATCLLFSVLSFSSPAWAQKESVSPGINKNFETPDVAQWIERFEREGRDVYDKRLDVVAACELKPGMVVADVGAGSGLFTQLFSPAVGSSGKVYAVDISDEFVEAIRKRCAEKGHENVTAIVCTPDDAKLPADSVDLVFICDTYHHFEFPQKTMASIHKALKPNGRVVVVEFKRVEGESSEWTLKHVRAGQEVFTKEIEDAGFKFLDEKPLFKEKYLIRFQRADKQDAE